MHRRSESPRQSCASSVRTCPQILSGTGSNSHLELAGGSGSSLGAMRALRPRRSPGTRAGTRPRPDPAASAGSRAPPVPATSLTCPDDPRPRQPTHPDSVTPGRCLWAPIELTPKALRHTTGAGGLGDSRPGRMIQQSGGCGSFRANSRSLSSATWPPRRLPTSIQRHGVVATPTAQLRPLLVIGSHELAADIWPGAFSVRWDRG